MLGLLEHARGEGVDVTFDSYPYVYSSTRLLIMFPDWIHDGGPDRVKLALRSSEARARLRREVVPRGQSWGDIWLTYFKQPHNHTYEGRTVEEVALMRVVFDPATVDAPATRSQPKQMSTGIEHVFVNGTSVIDGGRHSGAVPGRALHRGRD